MKNKSEKLELVKQFSDLKKKKEDEFYGSILSHCTSKYEPGTMRYKVSFVRNVKCKTIKIYEKVIREFIEKYYDVAIIFKRPGEDKRYFSKDYKVKIKSLYKHFLEFSLIKIDKKLFLFALKLLYRKNNVFSKRDYFYGFKLKNQQ
jgi:hypothetical protein